jgi:hypothetical protein
MPPMATTTLIIVNGMLALGLFAAIALVMSVAHRAAGARRFGRHWSDPLELEPVGKAREEIELERAA